MIDSARSSPAQPLRRAKSDAADAGAGLRLHSLRTLAVAFLCGVLYAMGMVALSGGGLGSWREGAPQLAAAAPPQLGEASGRGLADAPTALFSPDYLHHIMPWHA